MKKPFLMLTLTCLLITAFKPLFAKKLKAVFSYAAFNTLQDGPYLETYLLVDGKSVNYVSNAENLYQAVIEVTLIFKQNDSVITFKKYELNSPAAADTSKIEFNFLDQQRVLLPNGTYDLELTISDKNAAGEPFTNVERITIDFPNDKISISDIQTAESVKKAEKTGILTKSGYDIIPYIINYYPKNAEKITFYAEIYNAATILGKDEAFLINYYIESWENQMPLSQFNRMKRETARDVNAFIGEFVLKELPTGNYNLVVSIKDKNNETKSIGKLFFYRYNPDLNYAVQDFQNIDLSTTFVSQINTPDSIIDCINSLYPISTELERVYARNNLKRDNLKEMQKFFYGFWHSRDALNPANAWQAYAAEVQKVNKIYSTGNRKGYETDRGRVYLQYGAPNSVTKSEFEPSAYPYEIWHYYSLRNQSNRKFVFYSHEFATNDYELIHSDALGEINDPRWQIKIHKRDTPTHSLDPEDAEKHWGGRIHDNYKYPR
ncbi:MAG: hypothetical protein BWY70_00678 [Bacteroidetes bacterium ADurb.Bin408]|nr:MAG: hypothetical protein BWY70_00678 [Bacteroidetes bacterium ADurb.Bin408]